MFTILERLPEYRELDRDQRRAVRRRLWRLVFTWQWFRETLLVKAIVLVPISIAIFVLALWEWQLRGWVGGWGVFAIHMGLATISVMGAWWWLTRRSLPIWRRVIAEEAWSGRARYCTLCGYDMRFSDSDSCVECGASRHVVGRRDVAAPASG